MGYGYTGNILRVDLTNEKLTVEHQDENFYRKYGGGSALNMYYLLKEMKGGVDPLGPDNLLCFSTGVTTGIAAPGLSRLVVSAKSPLTGLAGDSQSGGFFPAELKFSGFDAIIIKGKADRPLYLSIINGTPKLHEAVHLWGKDTGEVESEIQKEVGEPKAMVLQCGIAGEKLVRFAALISMRSRANARNGMGAVMGSKNLRAICVRGKQRPEVFDKEAIKALSRESAELLPRLGGLAKYGTPSSLIGKHDTGTLPTRNFNSGVFEGANAINGMQLWNDYLKGRESDNQNKEGRATCYGCNVRCKRVVEVKEGKYTVDPQYGGPEYESLASFGSYCGVDDLSAVVKCNELCNRYGMDTLSLGGTLAWAMECIEEGLLTVDQLDGIDLRFGNADAMIEMVTKIAQRDGVGDILALGSERAADHWGKGHEYLTTTKKQETPGHMPHIKLTCGLIYAVNPFGCDHQSHEHDPVYEEGGYEPYEDRLTSIGLTTPQPYMSLNPEKVRFARRTQYFYSFDDTMSWCQFVWGPAWHVYGPDHAVKMMRAASGWEDFDIEELLTIGERRVNLMRAFNAREGADYKLDTVPEKFITKGLKGGPTDGVKIDREQLQAAITEYYLQAGWDSESGNPTKKTYERLGIEWVAEELGM
ncbi:aldehyde ferredoxin oxidoreductase family protein [Desulfosediminicola flagellatus]|uniref:aldehyde ferredoxin oxidoreductase family protein n=1 Tax=Desulfosediminicola flagellatus TaxID=2569541 RepID=UPI00142E921B|nr:aldehyde ferredoxin oxidoreductase family protein [Desulfosediminicola flagellatus]